MAGLDKILNNNKKFEFPGSRSRENEQFIESAAVTNSVYQVKLREENRRLKEKMQQNNARLERNNEMIKNKEKILEELNAKLQLYEKLIKEKETHPIETVRKNTIVKESLIKRVSQLFLFLKNFLKEEGLKIGALVSKIKLQ